MPKWFWLVVKLLVAAAGVFIVVTTVNWDDTTVTLADGTQRVEPGAMRLIREADGGRLFWAWLWVSPMVLIQATRWWLLLRCRSVPVSWPAAFRLTWAGQFFNVCLPGSTGGDLVRAASAARSNENRTAAVMSLLADRVAGLGALILLGAMAGVLMWSDPVAGGPAKTIAVVAIGMVLGVLLYLSPRVRRLLRIEQLRAKLPGRIGGLLGKIDDALYGYKDHWPSVLLAIGLSMALHACLIMACAQAGYAMGMTVPLDRMFVVMPVIMVTIALPVTYQGLGVADKLAVTLLVTDTGNATANQIVAMLMALRLINLSYGLLGSLALVGGQLRLTPPPEEAPPEEAPQLSRASGASESS